MASLHGTRISEADETASRSNETSMNNTAVKYVLTKLQSDEDSLLCMNETSSNPQLSSQIPDTDWEAIGRKLITLYVNKNSFERVPATLRKVPKEGIKACIKPLADMFKKLYCHDWEPQEKHKVCKAVRFLSHLQHVTKKMSTYWKALLICA